MNILEFTLALGLGSVLAGFLGALTGLGGGVVIIPLLVLGFGVDIHYAIGASLVSVIATSSSNFMIGVTAAASAGIYLHRGYIDPGLAMPVVLGVLFGSIQGARFLTMAKTQWLRTTFMWVIVVLAVEMLYNGITGRL